MLRFRNSMLTIILTRLVNHLSADTIFYHLDFTFGCQLDIPLASWVWSSQKLILKIEFLDLIHYTVRSLGALVSWGLTTSQNEPNRIPNAPQKIPIVIVVTILKVMSRSDDTVISSGFAGNTANAKEIITA